MKMKILAVLAIASLLSSAACAQTAVAPCVTSSSSFGGVNCSPVTTSNPLPVTTSSAGSAIVPIKSAAAESSHVLKASSGIIYGFSATSAGTAGYVFLFNATSAPTDGAVTPVGCYQLPANSTLGVSYVNTPLSLTTGITVAFSTTGCFTKTASATAFFTAEVQ